MTTDSMPRELPEYEYEQARADAHTPCEFCNELVCNEYHGLCSCSDTPIVRYGNVYCSKQCVRAETRVRALDRFHDLGQARKRYERIGESLDALPRVLTIRAAEERTQKFMWR